MHDRNTEPAFSFISNSSKGSKQRRKKNELIGEMIMGGKTVKAVETKTTAKPIPKAIELFEDHLKTHSPGKSQILKRYRRAIGHFARILGGKKYVEAVNRSDIDDYKKTRSRERMKETERHISPPTINFEVQVMRNFFNFADERAVGTPQLHLPPRSRSQ